MTVTNSAELTILQLLSSRTIASISPSDAARTLAGAQNADVAGSVWRQCLSSVREAAFQLARDGRIEILRKGKPIPWQEARGVIRLRLASPPHDAEGL